LRRPFWKKVSFFIAEFGLDLSVAALFRLLLWLWMNSGDFWFKLESAKSSALFFVKGVGKKLVVVFWQLFSFQKRRK
jgi:hypothetical protein